MNEFQTFEFEELSTEEMNEIAGGASKYLCGVLLAECTVVPGRYSSISRSDACIEYGKLCK